MYLSEWNFRLILHFHVASLMISLVGEHFMCNELMIKWTHVLIWSWKSSPRKTYMYFMSDFNKAIKNFGHMWWTAPHCVADITIKLYVSTHDFSHWDQPSFPLKFLFIFKVLHNHILNIIKLHLYLKVKIRLQILNLTIVGAILGYMH